jgi:rubrerythrin
MSLKGSRTEKNLLAAFAGESQARNRYTFYGKIASKEGFEGIANIFLETADNEREHAKKYFELLEGGDVEITAAYPTDMGDTALNLKAAAAGEHAEWSHIYPTSGKIAEEEGFQSAATIFFKVADVEVEHEKRYQALLARLKNGTLFKRDKPIRWKCLKCGRINMRHVRPSPGVVRPRGGELLSAPHLVFGRVFRRTMMQATLCGRKRGGTLSAQATVALPSKGQAGMYLLFSGAVCFPFHHRACVHSGHPD